MSSTTALELSVNGASERTHACTHAILALPSRVLPQNHGVTVQAPGQGQQV